MIYKAVKVKDRGLCRLPGAAYASEKVEWEGGGYKKERQ